MCEGQGIQTIPCPSRTPSRFKSGTFYFAENRKFLFCVDIFSFRSLVFGLCHRSLVQSAFIRTCSQIWIVVKNVFDLFCAISMSGRQLRDILLD